MSILERLRPLPRWKHADPAVRAAAVYELGPEEADALRALAREDAEARVRRAAAARLDDPGVLAEIARTDPDEDVRSEAFATSRVSGRRPTTSCAPPKSYVIWSPSGV